jgi:hypothetical protein
VQIQRRRLSWGLEGGGSICSGGGITSPVIRGPFSGYMYHLPLGRYIVFQLMQFVPNILPCSWLMAPRPLPSAQHLTQIHLYLWHLLSGILEPKAHWHSGSQELLACSVLYGRVGTGGWGGGGGGALGVTNTPIPTKSWLLMVDGVR